MREKPALARNHSARAQALARTHAAGVLWTFVPGAGSKEQEFSSTQLTMAALSEDQTMRTETLYSSRCNRHTHTNTHHKLPPSLFYFLLPCWAIFTSGSVKVIILKLSFTFFCCLTGCSRLQHILLWISTAAPNTPPLLVLVCLGLN